MSREFLVFEIPLPELDQGCPCRIGVAGKLHLATWASLGFFFLNFTYLYLERGEGREK